MRRFAWPAAGFFITVLVFLPFASLGVDVHHDSLMLKTALDVLSGQTLFRDSFTQYGALTTYLHVAALKLGGESLYSLKVLTVVFYGLAAAFLAATWQELMPKRLVALSFAFWRLFAPFYSAAWVMLPWASVPALAFQSAALYGLVRAIHRPGRVLGERGGSGELFWPVWVGAAAGGVFWCRTPVGVFLCIALSASCFFQPKARRGKIALGGLLGFGAVFAVFAALIWSSGAWPEWIEQTFVWPRRWAREMGGSTQAVIRALFTSAVDAETKLWEGYFRWISVFGFAFALRVFVGGGSRDSRLSPNARSAIAAAAIAVLVAAQWSIVSSIRPWAFILPVTLLLVFIRCFRRPHGTERSLTMTIACICIASWLQYYPITCQRHVFWALGPSFGFFVFLAYVRVGEDANRVLAGFAVFLAPLLISRASVIRDRFAAPMQSGDSLPYLARMKLQPENSRMVQAVVSTIQADPSLSQRPMLIDGPDALPGVFVSNRRNFHPFYVEWTQYSRTKPELDLRAEFVRTERPWIAVQPPRIGNVEYWKREYAYEVARDLGGDFGVLLKPRH